MNKPLLALGGATGSGKTELAIRLAKKHPNLVILSADSRQIYKHLDIGSAKVGEPGFDSSLTGQPEPVWLCDGTAQFLIDIAEPNHYFTLTDYQTTAYRLIQACWDTNKIPLLVGGTGLYIQAIIEGFTPSGERDLTLRQTLEGLTLEALQAKAKKLSITLNQSDWRNPRRLIRALERQNQTTTNAPLTTNTHVFVLDRPWTEQRDLAPAMVRERLNLGLIAETKQLLINGIDKDWLKNTGLSYRLVIRMLDGEFSETELTKKMVNEFRRLMRRQRTWFNRMPYAIHGNEPTITRSIGALL